jgi:hypothetical protein
LQVVAEAFATFLIDIAPPPFPIFSDVIVAVLFRLVKNAVERASIEVAALRIVE